MEMDLGRIRLTGNSLCACYLGTEMPILAPHCPKTAEELLCPGTKTAKRGPEVAPVTTSVSTSRLTRSEESSWDFAAVGSLGAGLDMRGR